jgi:hypothetical protein
MPSDADAAMAAIDAIRIFLVSFMVMLLVDIRIWFV